MYASTVTTRWCGAIASKHTARRNVHLGRRRRALGGGGCGNQPAPGRNDDLWRSGGSGLDRHVSHGGHAPDEATHVRLTFGSHDPVTVEVNPNGYFLGVLPESAS